MARRTFVVVDVIEILVHWYAQRAKAEVARSVGVDRETVAKYVAPAEAAGLVPGGPPVSREQWGELVREWFPELVVADLRHPTWAEISRFHERIQADLETITATTVWQRLRDEEGLSVSLASFRRYLYAHLPEEVARGQVTVRRDDPPPGTEAQVDYGFLGMWLDPASGRRRKAWVFVMVLSCSRHMFIRPVLRMDLAAWISAHIAAWEFFGGVTARTVIDNLRTGVLKPDLYDPKLNRTYGELAGSARPRLPSRVLLHPHPPAASPTRPGQRPRSLARPHTPPTPLRPTRHRHRPTHQQRQAGSMKLDSIEPASPAQAL